MRYCARCLYPENHPLGIQFDEEGVCSGCRVHEEKGEKDQLDWRERGERLSRIFEAYRSRTGKNFDCIIPVSGARDSHFIVHTVKNVYKMHPLLVAYNKHYNTPVGIRNLAYLRTTFGCDILTLTVAPQTVKKITRLTLERLGSMYWHCLAGQTVFPVQIAVRFKIPLVVWGAHQGCDQVGMFSHWDEVEMTRKYRKEHDLMGLEAEDLMDEARGLTNSDLRPFLYPRDKEIERVGVRGIYLNNYIRWDSRAQHEEMIELYGYETAPQHRTFDTYNDVDCFHYSDLHDFIKYLKWGYGKVSDHASREIRLKRLTRAGGIEQVRRYQHLPPDPENFSLFAQWIGMGREELDGLLERHRNPDVWRRDEKGRWELKDGVERHADDAGVREAALSTADDCRFILKPGEAGGERRYTLIGKGWAGERRKTREVSLCQKQ